MFDVPVDRTSFSTELRTSHAALTAVPLCVLGVLLLAAVVWRLMKRTFRLAVVIIVVVAAALMCVGLVVWGVTYATSRESIQEAKVEYLIAKAGGAVEQLHKELHPGIAYVETLHEMMSSSALDPITTRFPTSALFVDRLALSFVVPLSRSIRSVYYGTMHGNYEGGHLAKPMGDTVRISGTGESFPPWSDCPSELPKQTCLDHANAGNCGDKTRTDKLCSVACGKGVTFTWTLYMERDEHISPNGHVSRGYKQSDRNDKPCNFYFYDPRTRPWYNVKELTWSNVYPYDSKLPTVGITVSRGVYSPNGTHLATIATDYDMKTLIPLMQDMRPSEHSIAVLMMVDTTVIAVSLDEAELQAEMGRTKDDLEVLNIRTTPNWKEPSRIKKTIQRLDERYGNLSVLTTIRALLLHEDDVVMTVPLSFRGGLNMLLVVTVPYDDIMGEADDASALALGLSIVIIVVSSGFVLAMITLILLPMTRLQKEMQSVANMDLERLADNPTLSIIAEVAAMQTSFKSMVLRLTEYRNYIPLNVLPQAVDEQATEDAMSARTFESSKNSIDSALSSSHRSYRSTRVATMSNTLKTQKVTLVVGNIRGFSAFAKSSAAVDLQRTHEAYIEVFHTASQKLRGIVEDFSADRVIVSFNGAFPCSQHDVNGIRFCRIVAARDGVSKQLSVNTAATVGKLLCGSMGCKGLKRFSYVGRALGCVHATERFGAIWGVPVLVGMGFTDDMAHTSIVFEMRRIARVQLGGFVEYVCEVLGEIDCEVEEWMYQLESSASGYRSYNIAIDALYEGKYEVASDHLKEAVKKGVNTRYLPAWIARCCDLKQPPIPLRTQDPTLSEQEAVLGSVPQKGKTGSGFTIP